MSENSLPQIVRLIGTGKNPRGLARPFRTKYSHRIGDIVIRSGHAIDVRTHALLGHVEHVAALLDAGMIRIWARGHYITADEFRKAAKTDLPPETPAVAPEPEMPKEPEPSSKEEEESTEELEEEEELEEDSEEEEATEPTQRPTLPEGWEKMNKAGLEGLAAEIGVDVDASDTKRVLVEKISAAVKG